MSTPFDVACLDFLLELGIRRIKVGSGEMTNSLPPPHGGERPAVIESTGMADMQEVAEDAVAAIEGASGSDPAITVLHCTSNYPNGGLTTRNLLAMQTMARELGCPVGYPDHTLGIAVSIAAVALGAVVIEKHFTLDTGLPGPDHKASLQPAELAEMIAAIRSIERALGDGRKPPRPSETEMRDLVRKSLTARRDLVKSAVLTSDDVICPRPGTGIPPDQMEAALGRRLARDLPAGSTIAWADLAER